ncbi:hypothetical protein RRG08_008715 [Elysia crispata]|uniref:Uncharacterized protein n=1 Tax=Elysia crispata TaxID=231223 RepID=A0AAE0XPR7_9GAST|nr:hypothetical protein RRG08_008715 [Elysia crispata]
MITFQKVIVTTWDQNWASKIKGMHLGSEDVWCRVYPLEPDYFEVNLDPAFFKEDYFEVTLELNYLEMTLEPDYFEMTLEPDYFDVDLRA